MKNCDGARPEAIGKDIAKNTARRTQKRSDVITRQAAMRYSENLVVGLAQKILVHNGCNPDVQNILGTATTIVDHSLDTCSDLERRGASSSLTALDFDIENTYSFEFSTRDDHW